jgi:hypothetical protein
MHRFHIVADADVIIVSNSVYKQAKVYHRNGALYVGAAGGFVRLYASGPSGQTGLPKLRWDDIDIPGITGPEAIAKDKLGKLSLPASFLTIEGTTE